MIKKAVATIGVLLFAISAVVVAEDFSVEGTVNAVKAKDKKLNITHGPVKGVMDAMTMDFAVLDPAMLDEVKAGSKIRFTFSKDKSGNFVVTDLEPLTTSSAKK